MVAKLLVRQLAGSILLHLVELGMHHLQPHAENDSDDRLVDATVLFLFWCLQVTTEFNYFHAIFNSCLPLIFTISLWAGCSR